MTVRSAVYDQVKTIAEEQKKSLPPLTDELRLLESGLDSLCIAVLIANLDDELKISPFDADDVEIPVTLGDLVRIYEHAATTVA